MELLLQKNITEIHIKAAGGKYHINGRINPILTLEVKNMNLI